MTPAERECEDFDNLHTQNLHRELAEKDARIRELEGTLRFIATEWDLKPTIKELRSRAKAALDGEGKKA